MRNGNLKAGVWAAVGACAAACGAGGLWAASANDRILAQFQLPGVVPGIDFDGFRKLFNANRLDPNFRSSGYEQIRLGLHNGALPLFPFARKDSSVGKPFFVNLAPRGFLLGESNAQGVQWARLNLSDGEASPEISMRWQSLRHWDWNQALLEFSRQTGFASATSDEFRQAARILWVGGIGCLPKTRLKGKPTYEVRCAPEPQSLGVHASPPKSGGFRDRVEAGDLLMPSQRNSHCSALGVRHRKDVDLLAPWKPTGWSGNEGRICLLARQSSDDRQEGVALSSRMGCLSEKDSKATAPLADHVEWVIPAADGKGDWLLYEPQYTPPKSSRLDFATLRLESTSKTGLPFAQTQKSRNDPLPDFSDTGVYACETWEQSQLGKPPVWYHVSPGLFRGTEPLDTSVQQVWRIQAGADNQVQVKKLSWNAMTEEIPELNEFPLLGCALRDVLDVRCGIRVLQNTSQIAAEMMLGEFDQPTWKAHAVPVAMVSLGALARVRTGLGGWQLEPESALLFNYFRDIVLKYGSPETVSTLKNVSRATYKVSDAKRPWTQYLTMGTGFWQQLDPQPMTPPTADQTPTPAQSP